MTSSEKCVFTIFVNSIIRMYWLALGEHPTATKRILTFISILLKHKAVYMCVLCVYIFVCNVCMFRVD